MPFRSQDTGTLVDVLRPYYSSGTIISTTRPTTSLSAQDNPNISETAVKKTLCRGDYAGLSATFSAATGELIRVPEQLVPESMLEWGQIPSCLEVLVSEKWKTLYSYLTRQTLTILPETGCGVDNLETVKRDETMAPNNILADSGCISMDYDMADTPSGSKRTRVETVFDVGRPPEGQDANDDVEWTHEDGYMRVRVLVDFSYGTNNGFQLETPLVVNVERRTSETSSGGTIADGGGLDARTVRGLLGEELNVDNSFAEQERGAAPLEKEPSTGMFVLTVPGGIRIAYSERTALPWELQVSMEGEETFQQVRKRYTKEGSLLGEIDTYWKDNLVDMGYGDDDEEDKVEVMKPEVLDMSDVEKIRNSDKYRDPRDVDVIPEDVDTDEAFRFMLEQKEAWETLREKGIDALRPSPEEEERIASEFPSSTSTTEAEAPE